MILVNGSGTLAKFPSPSPSPTLLHFHVPVVLVSDDLQIPHNRHRDAPLGSDLLLEIFCWCRWGTDATTGIQPLTHQLVVYRAGIYYAAVGTYPLV